MLGTFVELGQKDWVTIKIGVCLIALMKNHDICGAGLVSKIFGVSQFSKIHGGPSIMSQGKTPRGNCT